MRTAYVTPFCFARRTSGHCAAALLLRLAQLIAAQTHSATVLHLYHASCFLLHASFLAALTARLWLQAQTPANTHRAKMDQTGAVPAEPTPEVPVAQPLASHSPTTQPLTSQTTHPQPPSGVPRAKAEPGRGSAPPKLAPILCTVGGRRPRTSYHPASPPPRSASQQQQLLQQLQLQPQQLLGHDDKALAQADDGPMQTHEPMPVVPKHITSALDQVRYAQGMESTADALAVYACASMACSAQAGTSAYACCRVPHPAIAHPIAPVGPGLPGYRTVPCSLSLSLT